MNSNYLNHTFPSTALGEFRITLHLDAAVGSSEFAPGPVADAFLDGAGARLAAVRRRSDDASSAPTSAKTTS